MLWGDRASGVGWVMNGIGPFLQEAPGSWLSPSTMQKHKKKAAAWKRDLTRLGQLPDLGPPGLQNCEKQVSVV